MTEDLLIARVAGERIAIAASAVQSVIELADVVPVPGAPEFIAGLATQRSRTLTVCDVGAALGLERAQDRLRFAVVAEFDSIGYALAVDAVECVISALGEVMPVKTRLAPGWARSAAGMVETSVGTVLLIDLARLVGSELQRKAA